jgi:hypothetical protein
VSLPFCVECGALLFFGAGKAFHFRDFYYKGRFYCKIHRAEIAKREEIAGKLKAAKIPIVRPVTGSVLPGVQVRGFRVPKERTKIPESAILPQPQIAGQSILIQVTEGNMIPTGKGGS